MALFHHDVHVLWRARGTLISLTLKKKSLSMGCNLVRMLTIFESFYSLLITPQKSLDAHRLI